MAFYAIYLVDGLVELHQLEKEYVAIARKGHLISTHKDYQKAWDAATNLAREKQLSLVDRTK